MSAVDEGFRSAAAKLENARKAGLESLLHGESHERGFPEPQDYELVRRYAAWKSVTTPIKLPSESVVTQRHCTRLACERVSMSLSTVDLVRSPSMGPNAPAFKAPAAAAMMPTPSGLCPPAGRRRSPRRNSHPRPSDPPPRLQRPGYLSSRYGSTGYSPYDRS